MTFERFPPYFLVSRKVCRLRPYVNRLIAFAQCPQHFAQMGGNFGLGVVFKRIPQIRQRAFRVAFQVIRPAYAVVDSGIVRVDLVCRLKQGEAFVQTFGIGKQAVARLFII